jgi:hypothetical protein
MVARSSYCVYLTFFAFTDLYSAHMQASCRDSTASLRCRLFPQWQILTCYVSSLYIFWEIPFINSNCKNIKSNVFHLAGSFINPFTMPFRCQSAKLKCFVSVIRSEVYSFNMSNINKAVSESQNYTTVKDKINNLQKCENKLAEFSCLAVHF